MVSHFENLTALTPHLYFHIMVGLSAQRSGISLKIGTVTVHAPLHFNKWIPKSSSVPGPTPQPVTHSCFQTKLGSAHPLSVEPIYWHQDLVRESAGAKQRVRVANAQETQTPQSIPGKQFS